MMVGTTFLMVRQLCRLLIPMLAATSLTGCVRTSVVDAPTVAGSTDQALSGSNGLTAGAAGPARLVAWHDALVAAPGGWCALDAIDGLPPANVDAYSGSEVTLAGWVADRDKRVPADAELLLRSTGGSFIGPLAAGLDRPDVARALDSAPLRSSGYLLTVALDVAPGDYDLLILHGIGASRRACALNARLKVVP